MGQALSTVTHLGKSLATFGQSPVAVGDDHRGQPQLWLSQDDMALSLTCLHSGNVELSFVIATQTGRGAFRRALGIVFDAVDDARIERVETTAVDAGRYAHAAAFARCDRNQWNKLKLGFALQLRDFGARGSRHVRLARQLEALVQSSDRQLGHIVAGLKALPDDLAGGEQPLAKQLFLNGPAYTAHWRREERDAFRAAKLVR